MKFNLKQRKAIKHEGSLTLRKGDIKITYGSTNGNDAPHLCDYRYDGYECNRFAVFHKGELVLISNTWTKLLRYLTEVHGL
jgi:hypothetical protein